MKRPRKPVLDIPYFSEAKMDGFLWKPNPHAQALGKLGGKVKSEAKAAAARENGKKGGRPPKEPAQKS